MIPTAPPGPTTTRTDDKETEPPLANIVISEFISADAVASLRDAGHQVHLDESLCEKPGELAGHIAGADALIVRNRTQVTAGLLAAAPNLKAVGRLGVGLDNIDLDACQSRGIAVLPAVGANAASVAEYVLTAALLLLRGSTFFGTGRLQSGVWPRSEMSRGRETEGKVAGLVGFGSIGQVTGRLLGGVGFEVIAHDEFLPAGHSAWIGIERVGLDDLLARADVVSLHCPLTPDTRGLIGAPQLAAMKPGAILINTARGGIVDEAALADALHARRIGGAALDVFETEPIDAPTAARFAGLDNILLTPHVAGVTTESNERISAITAENVMRVLNEAAR